MKYFIFFLIFNMIFNNNIFATVYYIKSKPPADKLHESPSTQYMQTIENGLTPKTQTPTHLVSRTVINEKNIKKPNNPPITSDPDVMAFCDDPAKYMCGGTQKNTPTDKVNLNGDAQNYIPPHKVNLNGIPQELTSPYDATQTINLVKKALMQAIDKMPQLNNQTKNTLSSDIKNITFLRRGDTSLQSIFNEADFSNNIEVGTYFPIYKVAHEICHIFDKFIRYKYKDVNYQTMMNIIIQYSSTLGIPNAPTANFEIGADHCVGYVMSEISNNLTPKQIINLIHHNFVNPLENFCFFAGDTFQLPTTNGTLDTPGSHPDGKSMMRLVGYNRALQKRLGCPVNEPGTLQRNFLNAFQYWK